MTSQEQSWRAVLERDASYDGRFVYAVRSTGIYCRPSCPARKPQREQVRFFSLPEMAEQAGFRACKRCEPHRILAVAPRISLIQQVCRYLEANADNAPSLQELADRFCHSPYYLQRLFKQITGVTPQQYGDSCRMRRVKQSLQEGDTISKAIYEAGFGSPSRLYSRAKGQLGMTPNRYRKGGEHTEICFAVADSPLGKLLVATTPHGICAIRLGDSAMELSAALREEFPKATIRQDDSSLQKWVREILCHLEGRLPHLNLPLDVRETAFQRQVWQALQAIPYGETRTYSEVAEAIGRPSAVRAVARACATNPVALAVPCHRVVRQDGSLSGYRWGIQRKQALLEREQHHLEGLDEMPDRNGTETAPS